MEHHPIESLMKTAMENLKEMVDVNKIVGDAVETPDGSVIIPISRVSFGFAAGGTEFEQQANGGGGKQGGGEADLPFGGGSGGGVSVPVSYTHLDVYKRQGMGCVQCKELLGRRLVEMLAPIHEQRRRLEEKPGYVEEVLHTGEERARKAARATLDAVRGAMGI